MGSGPRHLLRAIVSGETAKSKPNNPHEHWQIFAGRGPAEPSKRASGNAATEGGEKKKGLKNYWGEKHGAKRGECAGRKKPHAITDKGPLPCCCARISNRVVASLCRSGVVHRRLQVGLDARFNLACERAGGQQSTHATTHQSAHASFPQSPVARRTSSRGGQPVSAIA